MALSRLGLVKTTLIDFPGQVAATVFTPGCNLRCPYCHNPELVTPPFSETLLPIEEVRRFLQKRAAVLGGVCITGGEPLLYGKAYGEMVYGGTEEGKLQNSGDSQRSTEEPAGETGQQNASAGGLFEFILFCRQLGLKVKLDTNGCFPERLRPLLATGMRPEVQRVRKDLEMDAIPAEAKASAVGAGPPTARSSTTLQWTSKRCRRDTTLCTHLPKTMQFRQLRRLSGKAST